MFKRTIKNNLTFAGEPLLRGRHKIHPYPAMLHPLLVDYLISEFAKENDIVFDPMCGSGVTLLQSNLKGHDSFGFDINPLPLLIAKVKSMNYNIEDLINDNKIISNAIKQDSNFDIPEIKNIHYWYSDEVQEDLGKIRYILKNYELKYTDFFIVCFAYVCRNQSYTRNGEFKRYRIKEDKIYNTPNQVINKFFSHIESMIDIFSDPINPHKTISPLLFNTEKPIDPNLIYDIVITSPPYGDSRTTVAYGEYTSFGNEWTGDINPYGKVNYNIDKESVGKKGIIKDELYNNDLLIKIVNRIRDIDIKRSEDVLYFFNGYYNILKNVVHNLNENGKVCFVVGNRTVKGIQIPMDQITSIFFQQLGLKYENIFVRDILNKVMPSRNSPTNKVGVTKKTMANEYIVVFSK